MKNIHVLATLNPSKLIKNNLGYGIVSDIFKQSDLDLIQAQFQNIYITDNSEIKVGDKDFYIIANDRDKTWINHIEKVIECKIDPIHGKVLILSSGFLWIDEGQKIILTTDQDLIKDGIQAIDDEFLQWFVKNPSCERVEVSYGLLKPFQSNYAGYIIHLPDNDVLEEPKQEIVGYRLNSKISRLMVDRILQCSMPKWNDKDKSVYFIRGHVGGSLVAKMKELKVLDLWFTPIYESEEVKSDWIKEHHIDYYKKEGMMADKPKQETLEEAAKNYANIPLHRDIDAEERHFNSNVREYDSFIAGAKWQAEKMYSEEDMRASYNAENEGWVNFDFWFKQFKKQKDEQ